MAPRKPAASKKLPGLKSLGVRPGVRQAVRRTGFSGSDQKQLLQWLNNHPAKAQKISNIVGGKNVRQTAKKLNKAVDRRQKKRGGAAGRERTPEYLDTPVEEQEKKAPGPGFATGVSAATLQFVKEKAQARYAEGESEAGRAGRTRGKKKGGKTQKVVKRAVKQTGVKGKKLRTALRKPGLQPVERLLPRRHGQPLRHERPARLRRVRHARDGARTGALGTTR